MAQHKDADRIAPLEPLSVDSEECRRLTGLGERALDELVASKQIPHFRNGRKRLFPVAELREWIAQRRRTTGA